jgi:predicted transcriptional regulator
MPITILYEDDVVWGRNLGNRRSTPEIVAHILQKADYGATRTGMMYACGLSYKVLKEYVNRMVENGLLEYDPIGATYKRTEKGIQFLETYEQVNMLTGLIDVIKQRPLDTPLQLIQSQKWSQLLLDLFQESSYPLCRGSCFDRNHGRYFWKKSMSLSTQDNE